MSYDAKEIKIRTLENEKAALESRVRRLENDVWELRGKIRQLELDTKHRGDEPVFPYQGMFSDV